MKALVLSLSLLALVGGAAMAQTGKSTGSSAAPTMKGTVPEAPIGHRQPRASDVPNENNLSNPNEPMNKEDAALDRKLKSICRGC